MAKQIADILSLVSGRSSSTDGVGLWRIFLVDYVRHRSVYLFLIPLPIMISWILVRDPDPVHLGWFLLGWLIFLPQEYLTHVYILHAPAPRNPDLYRMFYRLHYGHHDLPKRSDLMYIPLWLTLPMLAANVLVLGLLIQDPYQHLTALCGLISGYLVYEWTHLFCHVPHRPTTAIGRLLRDRHLWHHSHNEGYWFSVSLPALPIDRVAGTETSRDQVARTGTTRHLGLARDDRRLLAARAAFASQSTGDLQSSRVWREWILLRQSGLTPTETNG